MAKFSESFIQGLLNPSYSQGLFEAAKGVGATPGIMMAEKSRVKSQAEVQQLLQQYANDPAQLTAMSQKYAAGGQPEVAKVFLEAANRATAKEDTNRQRGAQGGLMAITQGAARGVPLEDMREGINSVLAQGGTQAQIMEAYEAGSGGTQEPVTLSAGAALVNPKTGEVIAERGFKPEKPTDKGIKTVEREDGSVIILNANDGTLISTLDPPGKGEGDRDAALNLIAQTTGFIQDIDDLMDPGFTETGFIGGMSAMVPGTPAYDREKELLSIRARLGFDQINEMKRLAAESGASGTGLGQISNIEFMSLQSTIDAIYTGMSGDAQNKALAAIKKHLLNVQKLASGIAAADAIEWGRPEYKAVGYHQDPETKKVFYAPNGPNGTKYKLVDGKFVKIGA
jgi:hypothetical protein